MKLTLQVPWAMVLVGGSGWAQQYTISTFAGGGLPTDKPSPSASIGTVGGVSVDPSGNVLFTSRDYAIVLRLDAKTGLVSLVAGNGTVRCCSGGKSYDEPATATALRQPLELASDQTGSVYVVDNNVILQITNGQVRLVTGAGVTLGDNGPPLAARLRAPQGIAVSSNGDIYIADSADNRIRKISNGAITTVAGNGTPGYSGDNSSATSALLNGPGGITLDSAGNLYLADKNNCRVRKVSNGVITTIAGNGTPGSSGDGGPATSAGMIPVSVAVDLNGNLYVLDNGIRVRKISNGVITTVAGSNNQGFSGDGGPATSALLNGATGIAVDSTGSLYIGDRYRVRRIVNGVINTIVGGDFVGDDSVPTRAWLDGPYGVVAAANGSVFIADALHLRVRKVSNGVITTVAGNGTLGSSGDGGPATSASLTGATGVGIDSAGNSYIADTVAVREVSNGIISTVAGGAQQGAPLGDNGPAIGARISPFDVTVDSVGSLYIADPDASRIRKVQNGVITTAAGSGLAGFGGDNGAAVNANLNLLHGVAVDSGGSLYIADTLNHRIRKVVNGVITTIAGDGTQGFGGENGAASSAQLDSPQGVSVDAAGNVYIADSGNSRIRKISNGMITTIAGGPVSGLDGDGGPATNAQLNYPSGIAVGPDGRVYVADTGNNRIRVLTPLLPVITTLANSASNLPGPISPGEIVVLHGSGIGPAQLTLYHVGASGFVDCQLAGTTVQINGTCAPLIYTSSTQVAAIVPYSVTGSTAQVMITYQGQTTASFSAPVASSAPGIFTLDSTGKGPASCINQSGSIITAATPAKRGDFISCFATGEGMTSPPGVDGKPAVVPFPQPILPVSATIGGQTVKPQYAGGAPGEVAGVMQVNIQIPTGIQSSSAIPITLTVGNASSQAGVTIAVQ